MTERLLESLGGGTWQSGAALAQRFGVSRAAVWKGIARLRRQGYAIESSAGRGYRLLEASALLLPAEIGRSYRPRHLRGGEIVHREVVDSTNRLAADLARRGAPEGTIVIAERQTAGRGRLGRTWESPAHVNLYCSIILRPPLPPLEVPRLTLVAAIALAETVAEVIPVRPEIKWPNDLLLDGKKAVGILTELEAEAERVKFVILGIGVNVNAARSDFPPALRRKATSLAIAGGASLDRAAFTGRLLTRLDRLYGEFLRYGFPRLLPRYEAYHCLPGRRVRVEGRTPLSGVAVGIDDDGALLVRSKDRVVRVVAGEVSLRGAYRRLRARG